MPTMRVSNGGTEPQNAPEYHAVKPYVGSDWMVCIDGLDCMIKDLIVEGHATTLVVQPVEDDKRPRGPRKALDLFEIENFHVY